MQTLQRGANPTLIGGSYSLGSDVQGISGDLEDCGAASSNEKRSDGVFPSVRLIATVLFGCDDVAFERGIWPPPLALAEANDSFSE
jgi:hypothetical protein